MNLSTPRTNAFSRPENPNIITERIQNSLTNPKLQNLANLSYIIAHSLWKIKEYQINNGIAASILLLKVLADLIAQNVVPIYLASSNWKLPP